MTALGSAVAKPFIAAYSNRMGSNETPAEMVVRHVLEGDKHIADQIALIERLRLMGLPTEDAQHLLEYFCQLQAQHEEHLCRISDECELGLRDKQGNLLPAPAAMKR
ncbi:hypothetical protein AMC90_PA00065 (plasmid) [Rhizobium phaseoli]|uniref:Uncharacterized protein n=1 Tax=Rhizobium phaseoli TaxID=396 RepID=A0ABN4QUM5_9HYPH|nr:hypothetical protein [Rhizobium phaseoli]ANL30175.1 hypothetical protein AMC90_PA00065 [Rhizobium phaseoli]ANL89165.1 hypothetical protein AMC81_PE00922 [Rhizobium phaseoli]ANL95674.1 hypothetical protein AMC80_PE00922 [Rhizobium phaseoli]